VKSLRIIALSLIVLTLHTSVGAKSFLKDGHGKVDTLENHYNTEFYFSNEGLNEGATFNEVDEDTGFQKKNLRTQNDVHRYSIQLQVNADLQKAGDILGFEFNYGKKMAVGGWFEVLISKMTMNFEQVTESHSGIGPASQELDSTSEDLLTLGVGLSYRSALIQYFMDSNIFFDTTSVFATYNQFEENFYGKSYSGPGFRAEYGLHRRGDSKIHYGIKLSYNLASVKKPLENSGETSDDRSLLLNWLGLAFDISLYY
jgi:hypothetical protein